MHLQADYTAPSNIALIKYWGKHGLQLPQNPSLSLTLSSCHTRMRMRVLLNDELPSLEVNYDGQPQPSFKPKIERFFSRIDTEFPFLKNGSVQIDSVNTFPHGAGIASSASAFAALAGCILKIQDALTSSTREPGSDLREISRIARIGSGSACRSVYPVAALWGRTEGVPESHDEYAIPWKEEVHPIFHTYQDTILIVSASEKSVSSTAGHALMEELPYAGTRYSEASLNLARLLPCMKQGTDLDLFIEIVETEALQLHALMMSGHKPFILMEPNTLSIIREVWRFRKETGIPVCFTLDAGPNVHLLYPAVYESRIHPWIRTSLQPFCHEGRLIEDRVG